MPSTQGSGGALDFSRERITPLIARTPCLAALVHGRRESGGSNTAASKTYPGGSAAFVGANAPAGLASRPVPRVLLDEVDRFPTSLAGRSGKSERGYSIGEGDVYSVASKRTETFGRRRTIARVSTPVNVGGPIDSGFKAGDQRRFVVACPHCRARGILGWLGVDFGAKTKVVAAVGWTASNGADAALTCRECGAVWSESDRAGAVAAGEWVAERTDAPAGRRSYHVWAAYSPMSNLPSLAADYLAALATAESGDTSSMVTFRQATLGLPVGDEGVVAPSLDRLRAAILARRTDPAGWKLPDGTQAVGAVDVHGDRLEYAVWAFAPHEESWRLHHEIITGSTLDPETWDRLGAVIQESHHELPVERVAVDGGYRHRGSRCLRVRPPAAHALHPGPGRPAAAVRTPPVPAQARRCPAAIGRAPGRRRRGEVDHHESAADRVRTRNGAPADVGRQGGRAAADRRGAGADPGAGQGSARLAQAA